MKVELSNNKDFLAGLLLLAIGAIGFYMALDFPMGTARRMGPGYFPRVLSAVLMLFGLYVLVRGLRTKERVKGIWGWRPLAFITASLIVYGWLMDRAGFVPALVAMFYISALAGHEFKVKEVTILTVVMCIFAWAVFVYGLGLPYQLFWW